jgi:hypothetical protein
LWALLNTTKVGFIKTREISWLPETLLAS